MKSQLIGVAIFCQLLLLAPAVAQRTLSIAPSPQSTEQRVALVIGNSDYKQNPLKNPTNDATDMAGTLKELGFTVILRTDATRRQMVEAVRDFGAQIRRGGVGLFYYAGHGVQSKGKNFLIPIGAQIEADSDLEFESLDVNMVLAQMDEAGNRVNIVVLDACRDNPFARSFRSAARGLAQLDSAIGTFLAYATSPGSVAADGEGKNGIYTKHLLASLNEPGSKLEEVFKRVRIAVAKETGNKQVPWDSSSVLGDFYFGNPPAIASAPSAVSAPPSSLRPDQATWELVKGSNDPAILTAFLQQYPDSSFAPLVKAKLRSMDVSASRLARIPPVTAPVMDTTSTLAQSEIEALSKDLLKLSRERGSQLGILIVKTTKPERIERYAMRVTDAWKLGRAGINDGVVIIVAIEDRAVRIEVGLGLEKAIPDGAAQRILAQAITPKFRNGDFYGGLREGSAQLITLINTANLPRPTASVN